MAALGAKADLTADWKVYMPFDAWPVQVVETPKRVYFMSRTFEKNSGIAERAIPSHSLFYYDKEGDETISINQRMNSNGNAVACIGYNDAKKYLLVVYTDCNIDFIYDDGRVFNVPALQITSMPGKKEANYITFDNSNNRAYVATTFGYVALNDEKHEVAESRNYGENLQSVARCGDNIVVCTGDRLYYAPAREQRFGLEDYTEIQGAPGASGIVPSGSGKFVAYKEGGTTPVVMFSSKAGGGYTWDEIGSDASIWGVQQIPGGHRISGNVVMYTLTDAGEISKMQRPNSIWSRPVASYDGNTVWALTTRDGLSSLTIKPEAVTRESMRPNAPATYISSSLSYHPDYGMLCGSNGVDIAFANNSQQTPANISGLKGGFWKEFGYPYSGNSTLNNPHTYFGVSVDPADARYAYRGSLLGGMMKVDLTNPANVTILANPSNGNAGRQGFIEVAPDQNAWKAMCRFTAPQFSSDGTLWTMYYNRNETRGELWFWPASDRLATTSAATYRPMKQIPIPQLQAGNSDIMIALKQNKNMLVVGGFNNDGTILIYDHNGTPDNTSDDRYVYMDKLYDQDGGMVKFLAVNGLFEDPSTGLVWILSQRGVFTVNPQTAFEDPTRVNRVKVARNDGTNLADYLLNEINVNHLSVDGEGRKWFSTSNGLVCTTADGRQILAEFTPANSYLPGNNVFATCYNPDNNSMMVATDGGLVEMFPSGSGGGSTAESGGVRAYPNPVEPDYYGWVRIDNVADGSLVKITDAKGGVVKELGPVQGGSVDWDVSGLNNTRVATGVYYIMVSPGNGGGNAQISKILVFN